MASRSSSRSPSTRSSAATRARSSAMTVPATAAQTTVPPISASTSRISGSRMPMAIDDPGQAKARASGRSSRSSRCAARSRCRRAPQAHHRGPEQPAQLHPLPAVGAALAGEEHDHRQRRATAASASRPTVSRPTKTSPGIGSSGMPVSSGSSNSSALSDRRRREEQQQRQRARHRDHHDADDPPPPGHQPAGRVEHEHQRQPDQQEGAELGDHPDREAGQRERRACCAMPYADHDSQSPSKAQTSPVSAITQATGCRG